MGYSLYSYGYRCIEHKRCHAKRLSEALGQTSRLTLGTTMHAIVVARGTGELLLVDDHLRTLRRAGYCSY